MALAEAELARGDAQAAADSFERAAMMQHAADAEMGLVRAWMQLGHYRRALAFAAHAAGAHPESAGAGALYAWLLRTGGEDAVAERTLAQTAARQPGDPVVTAARGVFASLSPASEGVLLEAPHRVAPHAVMIDGQSPVAPGARVRASGTLIDGGQRVLAPAAAVEVAGRGRLWVRNGLGQTTAAELDDGPALPDALGITVLRLVAPLPTGGADALASSDPFAGSPGFVGEYAQPTDGAAWPWLRRGFLGSLQGGAGLRRLGIDVADGPQGGPVFDAAGRLAGIALRSNGQAVLVPASLWRDALAAVRLTATGVVSGPRVAISAHEAYERMLLIAVQVIVDPP